jgi:endo-1,4-beta-D-glucanase Y
MGIHYRIFGGFLIVLAIIIFASVTYRNSHTAHEPIIYSPTFMLNALWQSYQKNYIEPSSGRTLDKQRSDVTTSEGQSYTLLRAVWQDDKATFDKSWQWTKQNLQRPDDHLFSWLYGQKSDGSYGILSDQGGQNTATDADTDISLALVFASQRWQDTYYMDQAKEIIPNIWKQEVVTISGTPYVTADNIEKNDPAKIIINPSYFSPYAYKIFARIDTNNPWQKVVDSSYQILNKSIDEPLDKSKSAGLPPDWIALNRTTGALQPTDITTTTTAYGYDALRIPFRLAMDYLWNANGQAKETLAKLSFLSTEWENKKILYATYNHDGTVALQSETPAMYGGSLGYFMVTNPSLAKDIYINKLQNLYSPDNQDWKQQLGYYDDNWAWFGIAIYNQRLVNFYQQQ